MNLNFKLIDKTKPNRISFLKVTLISALLIWFTTAKAQEHLYANEFSLNEVTLKDEVFKHARDLNIKTLLAYDVDRLLAPYRKQAGLTAKDSSYKNWDGLDGHIAGHYLTAMAMNYESTGNLECKRRMDDMVEELKACQEANSKNHPAWGEGYAGGVPNSENIWKGLKKGDFSAYRNAWVPWYNVHKMYAGLRDAWNYGKSQKAKNIFLKFCDWAINITANLTDVQMQQMLDMEHGGMNEVLADAYQMTGNTKYMVAAKRFSHNQLLNPMAAGKDNLNNKHANTQVPKAIGFERIGELGKDEKYEQAGSFFWETVTQNRTLAFGGNSRREFFPSPVAAMDFINDVEGPESCNTYNMLKLTQTLFRENPSANYIDFYEKALYNHILSTQNPTHGGYVYFTPARPRHYRVYSSPNEAMWCCVGSGMENHGKYNEMIYTHESDSLYLNLFIASELDWKEKGVKVKQETEFPYQEKTSLTITEGISNFTLMIRYPNWVKEGDFKVLVNGKNVAISNQPSSYVAINRKWKKGDRIEVLLPMHVTIEKMPDLPIYSAIMYGPILLGAKTGNQDLRGLIADDSRWGHIASGEKLPVDKAPILISENSDEIIHSIKPIDGKPLNFTFSNLKIVNPEKLVLEPFYQIHDSRYMMYWMTLSDHQYKSYLDSIADLEKAKLELQARTIDFVAPGEQQPEADHAMLKENSHTGTFSDEFWRDANNEGFFSYQMATHGETNLTLNVRYWGAEWGNRKFDIYIDNEKLLTIDHTGKWNKSAFQNEEYKIPASLLKGKESIRIKFQALPNNTAGAIYYIRLTKAL